ncbi:uncharacterized protein LOC136074181 [Hydra vulgaris]|uniref:Uncharacterized protein LOC136074181 n=1 Tax=Hydra vulgaris TaxID=6087 RepID=A0ABM4B199_HYDVU
MTDLNVDFSRIQSYSTSKSLEAHLIEEARRFPCLWDTTTRSYKETPLKIEAWRQISALLNVEGSYLFFQPPVEHIAFENIDNTIKASSSRDNLTLTENETVVSSIASPQMIISSPNKMKRKMKPDPFLEKAIMIDVEQKLMKINDNDPDELFCKSLVSSFQNLSKKKNKIAKIKVMEILLELESDND